MYWLSENYLRVRLLCALSEPSLFPPTAISPPHLLPHLSGKVKFVDEKSHVLPFLLFFAKAPPFEARSPSL